MYLTALYCPSTVTGDHVTNNIAEYTGLIEGLKQAVKMGVCSIIIQGDYTVFSWLVYSSDVVIFMLMIVCVALF